MRFSQALLLAAACLAFVRAAAVSKTEPFIPSLTKRQLTTTTVINPLGTVSAGARVLAGDSSCPPSLGSNGVNTRIFAAVTLAESVTLSNTVFTSFNPFTGLTTYTQTTATVVATVNVCLCVDIGIPVLQIPITTSLLNAALADLQSDSALGTVINALLSLAGVSVSLTPTAQVQCSCSSTSQYPSCTNGGCTCINCPAGTLYSTISGACSLSASAGVRKRNLPTGIRDIDAIYRRQAKKEDIVRRGSRPR